MKIAMFIAFHFFLVPEGLIKRKRTNDTEKIKKEKK